jgi:hypothetical protein
MTKSLDDPTDPGDCSQSRGCLAPVLTRSRRWHVCVRAFLLSTGTGRTIEGTDISLRVFVTKSIMFLHQIRQTAPSKKWPRASVATMANRSPEPICWDRGRGNAIGLN